MGGINYHAGCTRTLRANVRTGRDIGYTPIVATFCWVNMEETITEGLMPHPLSTTQVVGWFK